MMIKIRHEPNELNAQLQKSYPGNFLEKETQWRFNPTFKGRLTFSCCVQKPNKYPTISIANELTNIFTEGKPPPGPQKKKTKNIPHKKKPPKGDPPNEREIGQTGTQRINNLNIINWNTDNRPTTFPALINYLTENQLS
jgi:hypothetical protein